MESPSPPYGRRLAVNIIDERARSHHARPYFSLPLGAHPRDGFRDVTYAAMARAVDRACWLLDERLGPATPALETFGWVAAPTDFRYIMLAFAAMKGGRKAHFPSPRNSVEAHLALVDECVCGAFLVPDGQGGADAALVEELARRRDLRVVPIPGVSWFLDDNGGGDGGVATPYPFDLTFEQARYRPCIVLHTSGSTGNPKCIFIRHGWFSAHDAFRLLPQYGGGRPVLGVLQDSRAFIPMPNFHSAAAVFKLAGAIFYDCTVVEYPSVPLTAEGADAYHAHADVQFTLLPPNILKEIAVDEAFLANTDKLNYAGSGGGALAPGVGDKLAQRLHPLNVYGSTEMGQAPIEVTAREDWAYMRFSLPAWSRFDRATPDKYELVHARVPELDLLQPAFVTFPGAEEWRTKDLFSRHPTKPDHWLHRGRADDVVVLSNGEKFVPVAFEQVVETVPEVSSAIVAGDGRFQPCLLVEPKTPLAGDDVEGRERLMRKMWPAVERANKTAAAHARVSADFVIFTAPEKPLVRAAKGAVQRRRSLRLYEPEIEALYRHNDVLSSAAAPSKGALDLSSFASTCSSLQEWVMGHTGLERRPDAGADLFRFGLDSLGVLTLVRRVNASAGRQALSTRAVYSNPTIRGIASLVAPEREVNGVSQNTLSREARMEAMYRSLSSNLPINVRHPVQPPDSQGPTVLLTGSTGSLGSYILNALHTHTISPRVDRVICLNRGADAPDRQHAIHTTRGLATDFSRVRFLRSDLSEPRLGLERDEYVELLEQVTHVIHNAWPVDFNMSLDSFEPHVRGLRNLIDFGALSAHGAAIHFLSTRATVHNHASTSTSSKPTAIPEAIYENWTASSAMGYAESKHVSERLLASASRHGGVPVSISRVGQIAGPVLPGTRDKGMWPRQEWLPSIVNSSRHLGKLPGDLGVMSEGLDWTPVDAAADIVAELALGMRCGGSGGSGGADVYHLTNPRRSSWGVLLHAVRECLADAAGGKELEVVPYGRWLEALRQSDKATNGDLGPEISTERNSALKLLDFLESLVPSAGEGGDQAYPVLDTARAEEASPTLRSMRAVGKDWMGLWMRQWGYC